jgi:PAS domain S-box-containing protein
MLVYEKQMTTEKGNHFTDKMTKQGWSTGWTIIHYLSAFLVGSVLLSLFSILQKSLLGVPMDIPRGFIIPIFFGGVTGLFISVWNRKLQKAYAQLRDSSTLYRTLVEQAADGIFISDAQGKYTMVNSSACAMLGYTQDELLQLRISDLISAEEKTNAPIRFDELREGNTILAKQRIVCKDGSLLPVEISARQLPDGRLQGIVRDITEREQAEAALREQDERLCSLINATPDIICFKDGNGRWLIANNADLELFQLKDVVDYHGKTDKELAEYSPFYRDAFLTCQDTDEIAWQNPPVSRGDEIIPRPDGTEKVYDVIKVPLFYEDGSRKGLVVLGRDITERKQVEEALRQTQKTESLGVLAGGVAHDFNNLLVAMLGQTSLALTKLRTESPARPHIEKAVKAAERAADLTRQMLAYSGRGHFEARPINLNFLIEENVHLFRASLPKNVTWRTELADSLPLIKADPGQMQQVIMNLILNGAQAVEDHPGTVTVVTGVQEMNEEDGRYQQYTAQQLSPGPYVTLEVRDNGRGMDADTLTKIFDPFFTTKETGRGLGLAAVLGIVRGHGGGLYVYSEPEQGTTFKLLFPIIQEPLSEEPAVPVPVPMQEKIGVVLVIDDEEPVRDAVADILETAGIQVLSAANGAAGIALYREHMADITLVLLDLSMPGMNGEETFQKLHSINPDIRIILSSGYNQIEATRHFTGKGLAAFLQKPFRAADLLAIVEQYRELPG